MSDEQKMPNVIYAGILDACEMSSPFNSSDTPYLRCDINPDDAVVVDSRFFVSEKREGRHLILRWGKDIEAIATLTAEREKVRELVEAADNMLDKMARRGRLDDANWAPEIRALHEALAQLKDQDDA